MKRRIVKRTYVQKLEVVNSYLNGKPVKEILETNNISSSSLYQWIDELCCEEQQ